MAPSFQNQRLIALGVLVSSLFFWALSTNTQQLDFQFLQVAIKTLGSLYLGGSLEIFPEISCS
jgi:hypothetical protein